MSFSPTDKDFLGHIIHVCRNTMYRSITHGTRTKRTRCKANVNIVSVSKPTDQSPQHNELKLSLRVFGG